MLIYSQIIGILMVVIFPKFGRPLDEHEKLIETCSKDVQDGLAVLDYSSKIYDDVNLSNKGILMILVPLYVMALMMVGVTLFYISFFKCNYQRRRQH
jgi:hypothetical protein